MNDTLSSKRTATLSVEGKQVEFPIYEGTIGPSVIDVRSLYKETGMFTYDPGFLSTGSCQSSITYIDGEEGVLLHRGYPIDQLAEKCSFLEVTYLLFNEDLPSKSEYLEFENTIRYHTMVHEQLKKLLEGFPRRAHPMAILVGAVGALSAFYHDSLDIFNEDERDLAAYRMVAKMPTLLAMAYKYSLGHPIIYPRNDLSFVGNFLYMLFGMPTEEYKVNPVLERALEKILILHADHEQNASTSTVRLASSSLANPFACIGAGISCLWGPSHGGANEAVIDMIDEIGDVEHIPEFIAKAKDKNDPFRLMGFGHRVYKNYDPRAAVLKASCDEVLEEVGITNSKKLRIAKELERIALEDDYFVERKLFPNVDFYSGIIYEAMGIPTSLFTALFAMARTSGWVAQWREMFTDKDQKIGRPRQLYTGATQRDVKNIDRR